MTTSGSAFGQLSYGVFYVPSIVFGYLLSNPQDPAIDFLPTIGFMSLSRLDILSILAIVSFLGAIQGHGIARAVYGPDGPVYRPKQGSIQLQHTLAIILNVKPDRIPIVLCRVPQNGYLIEMLGYVDNLSRKFLYNSSKGEVPLDIDPPLPKHRLEIAYEQLFDVFGLMSIWKVPRIIFFLPAGLQKITGWIAFLLMSASLYFNGIRYVPMFLGGVLFLLLFRAKLWGPIPDIADPDALKDRFTPEYKMHLDDNRSRKRINRNK
ncbi:hypothetical protein ACFR9U_04235 [Halorientalis brevis]|uniref:Uncharacterized protein n=1 Tax=Halorientalis brevis TaxID=1126241 RepID=A0ABD6C7Z9_9EURY|nr:hypothetical protein [Halorientalis brevis]